MKIKTEYRKHGCLCLADNSGVKLITLNTENMKVIPAPLIRQYYSASNSEH